MNKLRWFYSRNRNKVNFIILIIFLILISWCFIYFYFSITSTFNSSNNNISSLVNNVYVYKSDLKSIKFIDSENVLYSGIYYKFELKDGIIEFKNYDEKLLFISKERLWSISRKEFCYLYI